MFVDDEIEKLKQITQLYGTVKKLIVFCEENHEEFKSNLHVVKELRDAFDHLMRIFSIKLGLRQDDDNDYIKINMEKIFGHVYRAGYDTLDYATLILRDKLNKEVSGFSATAIQTVIPTYYSEIRPSVDSITDDIIKLRTTKDVANSSLEEFDKYIDDVNKLNQMYETVLKAKPSLIEYSSKKNKEALISSIVKVIIGIIIGIAVIILTNSN